MSDARRFGRNFGAIAFAQLLSQVLTLVMSLVLARTLGVEQYGIFIFSLAFPSWFILFVSLGLDSVMTIDVAADRSKAGAYLTAVMALRIPLVLATIAGLWVFVQLVVSDPFTRNVTIILGTASALATYGNTFRSVFRAFERLEFGALVTIVERVITTAGVLLLMFLGYGLLEVALVFLLGSVVNIILLVFITRRSFVRFERRVDPDTVKRIVKKTLPFALSAVIGTLLYTSGPILLAVLQDLTATGLFNASFALTLALLSPLTIYATVILPVLSRLYRETPDLLPKVIQRAQKILFIVGLPVALGGWFYAADIIVLFYGDAFLESARSFELLVFTVAIGTAVAGLGPALSATGHQKLNLYIGITAASTNVGLCIGLIPLWGPVGAAAAFVGARLVGAGLRMTAFSRLGAHIDLRETLARPLLAGLTMTLILYLLPGISLFLGILGGALAYFGVLLAIRGMTREDLILIKDALRGALFRPSG